MKAEIIPRHRRLRRVVVALCGCFAGAVLGAVLGGPWPPWWADALIVAGAVATAMLTIPDSTQGPR